MMIEIKGVQFVNKGAELMLYAVLQQLAERWPQASYVISPGVNSSYTARARVGALQKVQMRRRGVDLNALSRFLPKRIRQYLRRQYGLVFECDIDFVLDATGFGYGDAWGRLNSKLVAGEIKRARRRGAQYIFLPQAFGPFKRQSEHAQLARVLHHATLVCARDQTSYDHVMRLPAETHRAALADKLCLYPDFTNLLKAKTPREFSSQFSNHKVVLIIPNSNMLDSRNPKQDAWKDRYIPLLLDIVAVAKGDNLCPVILNHEGQSDQVLCEVLSTRANAELGVDLPIISYQNPVDVKGAIKGSYLVVSSRFHGCVSALSQSVPCLGTSWSHKYEALFADYSRTKYLLSPDQGYRVLAQLSRDVVTEQYDREYINAIETQFQQARAMWQKVQQHVD